MPRNRFQDAVEVQQGACNPRAILNAMTRAIEEMDTEAQIPATWPAAARADTDTILGDPAIRLMLHQLAFLCKLNEFDHNPMAYVKALEACEEKAKVPA